MLTAVAVMRRNKLQIPLNQLVQNDNILTQIFAIEKYMSAASKALC